MPPLIPGIMAGVAGVGMQRGWWSKDTVLTFSALGVITLFASILYVLKYDPQALMPSAPAAAVSEASPRAR